MATDAQRLRAERLYVEGGKSVAAIAADIGVHRSTVYDWRTEGDWDSRRRQLADKIQQATDEASDEAAAKAAVQYSILSRAEGLSILAEIARDRGAKPGERTAAVKAHAEIDGWAAVPKDDGDRDSIELAYGSPSRG